jgi:DNA-binding LacI/PurR family transcriptional regulator
LRTVLEEGLAVVTVNRVLRNLPLPAVASDNQRGAYEATCHLLAKGGRRLALILGTPGLSTTVERNPVGMGAKAVEELARVIEIGRPNQALTLIPTRLVIRTSCGCAMGEP